MSAQTAAQIRKFYESFNRPKQSAAEVIEWVDAYYTKDVSFEDVSGDMYWNYDVLTQIYIAASQSLVDQEHRPLKIVANDHIASVEWEWVGKLVGQLGEFVGKGQSFSVLGATIFEFRDGKICRQADYWQFDKFAQQVTAAV